MHTLWPVKYCTKAGANLDSLTSELLEENKVKSDHKKNNMVQFSNGNIILDHHIKTHKNWIARVKFLQELAVKGPS